LITEGNDTTALVNVYFFNPRSSPVMSANMPRGNMAMKKAINNTFHMSNGKFKNLKKGS